MKLGLAVLALGLSCLGWGQNSGLQQGAPWAKFRGSSLSSGLGVTGGSNGLLRWTCATNSAIASSPVIAADGTIYVVSNDGYLRAISPSGSQLWEVMVGISLQAVAPSPTIGSDGTIYVNGLGHEQGIGHLQSVLYAISPSGSQKWAVVTEQSYGSPAVAVNGTIYIDGHDNSLEAFTLYAFNTDGSPQWEFITGAHDGDAIDSTPAVGSDGTIYVASQRDLFAISPNGSQNWFFSLTGGGSSPAVGPDGTIFLGSTDGNLYAINPTGTQKWAFNTGYPVTSSAGIDSNGYVYVGGSNGVLYAIYPFGTEEWNFDTTQLAPGSQLIGSPSVGSDGTVFVPSTLASGTGLMYSITLIGAKAWSTPIGAGGTSSSPAIGADGAIYVGGSDGNLYAMGTEVNTVHLGQFGINPGSLTGTFGAVGNLVMTSQAPPGGDVITLASDNPAVQVPPFVVVSGGATTASFNITTKPVAMETVATVTAISGGRTLTAILTVEPAALSRVAAVPSSVIGGATSTGTVTLNAPAPPSGMTISLSSNNPNVIVPPKVFVNSGFVTGTFSISSMGVATITTASITATFSGISVTNTITIVPATLTNLTVSPVAVVGGGSSTGTVYFSGATPSSGLTLKLSSGSPSIIVPTSVQIPGGVNSGTFPITTKGVSTSVSATVTASLGNGSKSALLFVNPIEVIGFLITPGAVIGGSGASATVSLNTVASAPIVVKLASSTKSIKTPSSVTISSGGSSATFPIATSAVPIQTTGFITALLGTSSQQGPLIIQPPTLDALSFSPTSVKGSSATAVAGTITLTGPAPSSGFIVKLTSSNPNAASTPLTVTVPSGKVTATFRLTHKKVIVSTLVVITATHGGSQQTAEVTITP